MRRRCRKRYGDLDTVRAVAIRFEREHNLNVTARMLLYGGFNVFARRDFNDLGGGKNGKTRALDNLRAVSLATRKRQHRRTDSRVHRKSWFAKPKFRSPRQDSRRAFGCDRMCSLVYLPLFLTGRHLPDDACRIVFAFATARFPGTARLIRDQQSLRWGLALRTCHSRHYREAI